MGRGAIGPAMKYLTQQGYTDRISKAQYVLEKYRPLLGGSVLDVGCWTGPLRALLPAGATYVGVDRRDDAEVVLDLDRQDLPFEDRRFDTVLCTDVLEHLERCHAVFDELCRVSRRHVIISLPNPLRNLICSVFAGSGGRVKFYGLPVDPPRDRHRWFFGAQEAREFLTQRGERNGFEVEQLDAEDIGCCYWLNGQGQDVLDEPNFQGGTTWCVLRRGDAKTDPVAQTPRPEPD